MTNIEVPKREKALFFSITLMLSTYLDRCLQGSDQEFCNRTTSSSDAMTKKLVARLEDAIDESGDKLNPNSWRQIVDDAARDATNSADGQLTPIVTFSFFRDMVLAITEVYAAPAGSEWYCEAEAHLEDLIRTQLQDIGEIPRKVERTVEQILGLRQWAMK